MVNGRKNPSEVGIQMPEAKFAAESTTMSGPLVSGSDNRARRKTDMAHIILRFFCLLSSIISLCFMASAKQSGNVSIYGFSFPVYSKWSFADSFEYLLGISAAVAAHSLLQLLLSLSKLYKKLPVIPSRNHAWLIFAGDQVFAYAMMSAASAASGVTNLNRTGIRHTPLPDFCKPLRRFCDHVAVSVGFAFLSCFVLAISTVLDVIWLSKY
ncbi:CASP-like protein 3A1 [Macadamia integrifolia]|uniref:CASP-like protein 3A1 n=1 Tax=Macadamia integrifolia TaxID=60698 RepID=UPI001C4F51B7|nr:CASP-like protein 3A1 [Macadamia integrifolia]